MTTATPAVFIAEQPAAVLFSGLAPGFAGLWQLNVRIPTDRVPSGEVPVFVAISGAASTAVVAFIQ